MGESSLDLYQITQPSDPHRQDGQSILKTSRQSCG